MNMTYRQQTALTGALVGAVTGALLALVYANRALSDDLAESETQIKFTDLTRIAVAVGALVRQINSLAEEAET